MTGHFASPWLQTNDFLGQISMSRLSADTYAPLLITCFSCQATGYTSQSCPLRTHGQYASSNSSLFSKGTAAHNRSTVPPFHSPRRGSTASFRQPLIHSRPQTSGHGQSRQQGNQPPKPCTFYNRGHCDRSRADQCSHTHICNLFWCTLCTKLPQPIDHGGSSLQPHQPPLMSYTSSTFSSRSEPTAGQLCVQRIPNRL